MIYDTIKQAKTRDDVVPAYAALLQDRTAGLAIAWESINIAIIEKWSVAGLRYIKEAAYKMAYPKEHDRDPYLILSPKLEDDA